MSAISMSGKVCIVTGATSGIGRATALALAQRSAIVVLVCRNRQKGEDTARDLRAMTRNDAIDLLIADLSSQQEIRALTDTFNNAYPRLHVLVNNAGALFPKRRESVDGIEMTLAVNHLAPFLLTNLILDKLKAAGRARIINVNSDAHEKGNVDFSDLQMRHRYPGSVGMRAYANAKLANLLTVYELARRLQGSGVTVNALHPGYVATNIVPLDSLSGPARLLKPLWGLAKRLILTPEHGATTPVYLASSPQVEDVSGSYFEKCVPVASSAKSRDRDLQARMWQVSEQLTAG
jgi:NAD(P)-dependent dehydrogenase (short-subunit alcohol dehydrogenase family)